MTSTIAIIGCGKQASKHIAGLRAADPSINILLADINPSISRALAHASVTDYVDNLDDVFLDSSVKAICICTPTAGHAPLIRRAIAAGKHFCCEKPLTDDLLEAMSLIEETKRARLFGMIGYTFRFAPGMMLARDLVVGALSDPARSPLGCPVSAIFRIGGRGNHAAWKHQRMTHGGAINEMLVHVLDLALWFFGPLIEVKTLVCRCLQPNRRIGNQLISCDTEDLVVIQARTEGGVEILLHADFVSPAFIQYVEIHGTEGSLVTSITPDMPSFVYTNLEDCGYKKGRTEQSWGGANFYIAQMRAFLEGVEGRDSTIAARIEQALPLLKIMDQIRRDCYR